MAKQRSGLGRGLGSLLGGDYETAMSQDNAPAVPNVAPSKDEPAEKDDENVAASGESGEEASQSKSEEIYSSKEDNVTIKGVVEREVKVPAPKKPALQNQPYGKPIVREETPEQNGIEIDIELVEPNPYQPRTNFKGEELEELAESIKKNGLLQPILVRKIDDHYQIIAGERRWQACKSLGKKKIPAVVKEADDDETIILGLIENIQRSNLNPIEEAYGYKRMMERGKMTQSEVAQAVSKGRTTITNALRLLELPEEAQRLLYEEKITAGHARAILSVPSKEGRSKLTDKLIEQKLSVRDAERIARLLAGKKNKDEKKEKPQAPKSYKTVARALRDSLDTEVKIKSVNGKNKIEITFKDEADLQRLYRAING